MGKWWPVLAGAALALAGCTQLACIPKLQGGVKSGKAAVQVVRKNESSGGGGTLDGASLLALSMLVAACRIARSWRVA